MRNQRHRVVLQQLLVEGNNKTLLRKNVKCGCYWQGQFEKIPILIILFYSFPCCFSFSLLFPMSVLFASSCVHLLLPILNHVRPEFGESKISKFDIFKLNKNFSNQPVILRKNQPSNFYVITSWHVPPLYQPQRPKWVPNLLRFQKLRKWGVEGNKQFKQAWLFMIPAVP
jgi:hypothetical protein